ncbi:THAP domain-containing protein 1 isoform X7 [Halyomorpha halys]|uniref:THAP domain-containing protein 1 isoform X7 n=1 Tax=Halyomorpha halys TaxID=286706 RepID=UPI000D0C94F4|nr:THAP domain-containing protein 1-like isoform X7 [Halyomorpha halys]
MRFPSDEKEKKKWILAVNRNNWKPSKRSYLCSRHFTQDCFDRSEFYVKLNKGAFPTIFDSYSECLMPEVSQPPSQQETWTPPIIEQPTPPPLKKLKQSPKDTAEELLGLATEYLNKPESEWEVMAKGWALKLSKLATDQRLFAEKIINDTLFEAQMGTLTRNGVRFLTASDSDSCRSSSKNEKFL